MSSTSKFHYFSSIFLKGNLSWFILMEMYGVCVFVWSARVCVYGVMCVCGGWCVCVCAPFQGVAFDVYRLRAMARVHYKTLTFRDAKFLLWYLNFSLSACLLFWFYAIAPLLSHQLSSLSPRTLLKAKCKSPHDLLLSLVLPFQTSILSP